MCKKTVLGVLSFILAAALPLRALADQSPGFQYYLKEGVKAHQEHDDDRALRYFSIAHIFDPGDAEVNKYLSILQRKGAVEQAVPVSHAASHSTGYKYYLNLGIKAFHKDDLPQALRYFRLARIYYPDSRIIQHYLDLIDKKQEQARPAATQALPSAPAEQNAPSPAQTEAQPGPQPGPVQAKPNPLAEFQRAPILEPQAPKGPPRTLSLAQITSNGAVKPKFQLEIHSSVIIEGRNFQRFLVVDEGYLGVRIVDTDHIQIDGLHIGSTFVHIWDATGRNTLYIEVVFPASVVAAASRPVTMQVEHAAPFRFTYSHDYSTFYSGRNAASFKREGHEFQNSLGVIGETPYGFFDAYGHYEDFDTVSQLDTYTMGLSQIPIEGTSNFSIRAFDSLRYTSPLTLPGTRLRGVFADVDLMDNTFGLSVSHGREQVPIGFLSAGSQFSHSWIDAVKLTLNPHNEADRYSVNVTSANGPDRPLDLSNHVYSVEGQHMFTKNVTLNGELGNDSHHNASLASLKWQSPGFRTALNFRDLDRNYSTISTLPAYQGEIGGSWVTDMDYQNFSASSFAELYRDRLFANPDNPNALNFDANEQARYDISPDLWTNSDFNFVDTPGEMSVQHSLTVNQRLSKSFGIWHSLKATVFAGGGYQNSHAPGTSVSNFNRENAVAGFNLPLTTTVSTFASYEYDWLNQRDFNGDSNPRIISGGVQYLKLWKSNVSFNTQLVYRDEMGVNASNSTFLAGEQSLILSSSLSYNPTPDFSIYTEGNATKILSHLGNPPMDEFEVHAGMRITFGGSSYWDPVGTVSGIVFKDRLGNGKFAPNDQGMEGVKIKVGDKIAVTDKKGRYSIKIHAKRVEVTPVMDTVPGGFLFSTPQARSVEIIQGRTAKVDFGLTTQTGIYGIVFVDTSGRGVPSGSDKFIGKLKVILDGKTVEKSDGHGAFYFRNVSPGPHTISIDINSLGLDMIPQIPLQSQIQVAEGTNYMFNIPVKMKEAQGDNS